MTDNLRGILAVLAASSAFVGNDTMVKLASAELPSGEIIIVRGAMATALLSLGVVAWGAMRPLRIFLDAMMMLRLGSAAAATVFIVVALRHLSLATVNTILQVTPLAVTAGAALVYNERVGWRRWTAACTGFLGVVLIIQPGAGFETAAYWALIALLFTTIRDLSTRGLGRDVPSVLVAAASAGAITLAGSAVAPFDAPWTMPSAGAWSLLTASAACLFISNTCIIVAMRTGELSVVAPFRYIAVPLAIMLGYLLWGDVPNTLAVCGMALVAGAGLYTLLRERAALRARTVPITQGSAAQ